MRLDNKELVSEIKKGKLFIFPTDAGYCMGCNALKQKAVNKLVELSNGEIELLAPSKEWVGENFRIRKSYVEQLPGPFIYVLRAKRYVKAEGGNAFKVRMPEHSFTKVVGQAKVPVAFAEIGNFTELKRIPPKIARKADFVVDAGRIERHPLSVVDFTGNIPKILLKREHI
ncbi:MAG: Sua5/YciO/YrdC/YwlC family protein [Candidatus Woesearchaeota archaeon]